jgi:hypothetical protein
MYYTSIRTKPGDLKLKRREAKERKDSFASLLLRSGKEIKLCATNVNKKRPLIKLPRNRKTMVPGIWEEGNL